MVGQPARGSVREQRLLGRWVVSRSGEQKYRRATESTKTWHFQSASLILIQLTDEVDEALLCCES